jgi:hypothetical protein
MLARYKTAHRQWRQKYDVYYFKNIAISIYSFLKTNGYVLLYNMDENIMAKNLEEFCWSHEWIIKHEPTKNIIYPGQSHDGIEDDYDWFCEKIDQDDWETFFSYIKEDGIFDDSKSGSSMKYSLPYYLWKKMNLPASKSYRKYAAIRDNYSDREWDENDQYDYDE